MYRNVQATSTTAIDIQTGCHNSGVCLISPPKKKRAVAPKSIAPLIARRYLNRNNLELYALGVLFALCPALEIWYKPHFPYHFSQSAFGLTILLALGLQVAMKPIRNLHTSRKSAPILVSIFLVGANLLLFRDYAKQYYWQAASAIRFIPVMIGGDWTSEVAKLSVYLRAAQAIRESTSHSATMMTESSTVGLFPLASRLPMALGMGSITRVLTERNHQKPSAELEQLIKVPPDVLVLMSRKPAREDFGDFPLEFINRYARRIDQGRGLAPYGGWSAEIYLDANLSAP